MTKGICTYDVIADQGSNYCPMCSSEVHGEKCGFTECEYGYTGVYITEENGMRALKKVTS